MRDFSKPNEYPENVLGKTLRSCGQSVRIFHGARLYPPERIDVGSYTQIDEGVSIYAGVGVCIGRNVHFAFGSSISGGGSGEVGDFVSIGSGVKILTGSDIPVDGLLNNPTIPSEYRSVERMTTRINDLAIVYTSTIVFPGVTIGSGAVVAAGSLVHHDLQPWRIYAGNPLTIIGVRDEEKTRATAERIKQELG